VIGTFRKANKNLTVLQQMLTMLPCKPDALRIPAEDVVVVVVYSLEFFPGNC
jgi:hypothetical protein